VYDVDDQMLSLMDHFEGHPEVYSRDRVRVHFLGPPETSNSVECWAYFLKGFPPEMLYEETTSVYNAYSSKPYQPESVGFVCWPILNFVVMFAKLFSASSVGYRPTVKWAKLPNCFTKSLKPNYIP